MHSNSVPACHGLNGWTQKQFTRNFNKKPEGMQQQARADSSQADLDASTMGYNAMMGGDERGAPPQPVTQVIMQ